VSFKSFPIRQIRVFWVACFAIAGLYICVVVPEITGKTKAVHITALHWVFAAMAAYCAVVWYIFRRKIMAQAAVETSRGNTAKAGKKWATAQLVALSSALAVVFDGGFARMLAAPRLFAGALYLAGIVLLIRFKPAKLGSVGTVVEKSR